MKSLRDEIADTLHEETDDTSQKLADRILKLVSERVPKPYKANVLMSQTNDHLQDRSYREGWNEAIEEMKKGLGL
jgi:hypothetical protein